MSTDQKMVDIEKASSVDGQDLYMGESSEGSQTETKLSFFDSLASVLHAEKKGIERVTEEERDPNETVFSSASMWFSANMVIASMSLGMLGQSIFGISFWQSFFVIIFFNIIGLIPVAFFSMFGPEFGLRQMILSRYLTGVVAMRIFAFITAVACVGWGAVNIMVSAQLLNTVNRPHNLPPWAGCLILIISTIVVSLFGYKVVHLYEKWAWLPNLFVFLVFIAQIAKSGDFTGGGFPNNGQATIAGVLSFGGTIYGFATGWTTYAADYTVYVRHDYPKWKIFVGLSLGLFTPSVFTQVLGAACYSGVYQNETWMEYYTEHSAGGLMYAMLSVNALGGFGQFCSVLLAMSTVANNIPNMYTISFCLQSFWSPLSKVPRIVWTLVGNFLTLAICIPAYYHFEEVMDNFMNLIGYYLAIYEAISLSEHFIYRRGFKGYDISIWDDKSKLPIGIAGTIAFCFGVFGAVMGMDQVWYMGEISKRISGADIGFELSFSFAFVTFNIARPLELKYFGR
ncbi:Purine-cytosine permease FCY2 [Cyberlindnera fabianii]|uniref:Purine-cytosine permease FCY2 n=1 Tax=Cyberlindnera fabianii TaxID=36022 RepID=A0A1V2L3R5_CYBFA|nr:Purine-cytosine permease FCY2 [Cyberlindnera fabianii]